MADKRRPLILSMRGNPEWREWLSRLAKHCRTSAAVTIDQALVELAKLRGFNEPPPER